ncbi:glucan endo-1,3-beta-glucosidase-like [Dioscorea cayenensis subsp. rotundata]|uniref:Glucan endo-1,3-beta-glucosidase-like n=1 Tax=Dioscorea cayennensis subsp. rotundata TaxID=55577 RepID=A0AB40BQ68_DIOCR|nr:glucan endo-1,3-beta-glucosidase-like [Dioscorea cayenensis subsp. rotundata]
MRLYDPNLSALEALRGSNIEIMLSVSNDNLQSFASDPSATNVWVQTNIKPYSSQIKFKYIAVGNEVIPGKMAQYVLPAIRNIRTALLSVGREDEIKVSTVVFLATFFLANTFSSPLAGLFSSEVMLNLVPIIQFLNSTGSPLLVNVYPYLTYINNKDIIDINYALFTSPGTVVTDGSFKYQNLFDAMLDTMYSALEKAGGSNVGIVVSESGWPSAGGDAASVDNARTYYQNLINHVGKGTPKRPGAMEAFCLCNVQ